MGFDELRTGDVYEYDQKYHKICERMYFLVVDGKTQIRDNNNPALEAIAMKGFISQTPRLKYKLVAIFNAACEFRRLIYVDKKEYFTWHGYDPPKKTNKKLKDKITKSYVISKV